VTNLSINWARPLACRATLFGDVLKHWRIKWSLPGVWLVNPEKLGFGLLVFIQIKTAQHSVDWTRKLAQTAAAIPQVIGLNRMSGDLDYLIKAQVADIADYDSLYQRLISALPLMDVSASFATESIKDTTEVPVFM